MSKNIEKKNDIKLIEDLMKLLQEKGLTEVSYETKGFNITLKGDLDPMAGRSVKKAIAKKIDEEQEETNAKYIRSKNIGIYFYIGEDGKPKIEKGQSIKKGADIGYILTLGVKNSVRSDYSGKIQDICVENGSPVDYGRQLIMIKE